MTLAQQTYVPDDNFESYLEVNNMGNGIPNDDYVTTANINTTTYLAVNSQNIADLTGIADFTAVLYLDCTSNQLTTLDVSQNTALTNLQCNNNQLTCLDISNTFIVNLSCENNLLEQLNTKNGTWNLGMGLTITAQTNNLMCVEVDNLGYANSNWISSFDNFVTFSTNCNYTNPCNTTSAIEEHSTNKKLLKVTDLLGRETKQTNQPLFYIYDDGTVEKRITVE
jgi:hypothetical protein